MTGTAVVPPPIWVVSVSSGLLGGGSLEFETTPTQIGGWAEA